MLSRTNQGKTTKTNPLDTLRHWLDSIQIQDTKLARFLAQVIPGQCPFEKDITLFGHKVLHIPRSAPTRYPQ